MNDMKASKALNPDGIPSFILKELRDELCLRLNILAKTHPLPRILWNQGAAKKNWLSACLTDRKIAVKVADTLSKWTDATSGIPQGSVLVQVLFVMYIEICTNTIFLTDFGLFADDTKLLGEAIASSQIQNDLDALTEKLEEWQLSPNVAKCSVVHLLRQNPKYSYKMKGRGVTLVDPQLEFDPCRYKTMVGIAELNNSV
ncbi:hypothetical protein QYM36_012271 [Artemia franciscana]|uniref:Reverse transcriptase domain-containing protein n=1 Tax=Artemia franciscana TaxID=6661 RepID=A0AA88L7L0_ARTSF|nr:hypothetical protein QYM36_012271 [Artemia franciscana]